MNSKTMTERQWRAIKDCDKSYDGIFFYALKSTKTVCRPSCTARTPNPKNVEIYDSVEEAAKYGYRPCQRCRPDQMDWPGSKIELANAVKEYINEHYNEKITSNELGEHLLINPFYMHRVFKEISGTTIIVYQHYVRIEHAKNRLSETNHTASFISSELGYSSLSHFSRIFKKITGETPSKYRKKNKS